MKERPQGGVLAGVEATLRTHGRAALCQIVRAEGSTPGKPGWKLLVAPDGTVTGNLGGGAFEALVKADGAALLREADGQTLLKRYYFTEDAVKGQATGMVCGGMAEVFLEVLRAAPVLVLCGGGPVAQAVAQGAGLAGFDVAVVEDREAFRRPELFPAGVETVAVTREYREDFLRPFEGRDLAVAILTRCWETDTAALAAVLRQRPSRLRYLGLMGSRRKIVRVRAEIAERGLSLDGIELRAPIGLPIGGDTPGEIALAILAELVQARHASAAGDSAPSVHEPSGVSTSLTPAGGR
jgi:xanthine dehydrogenase accessory factor